MTEYTLKTYGVARAWDKDGNEVALPQWLRDRYSQVLQDSLLPFVTELRDTPHACKPAT